MSKIKDIVREDMIKILREYVKDNMNEKDTEIVANKKLANQLVHILDNEL